MCEFVYEHDTLSTLSCPHANWWKFLDVRPRLHQYNQHRNAITNYRLCEPAHDLRANNLLCAGRRTSVKILVRVWDRTSPCHPRSHRPATSINQWWRSMCRLNRTNEHTHAYTWSLTRIRSTTTHKNMHKFTHTCVYTQRRWEFIKNVSSVWY